jgi:hypothetical protein
MPRVASPNSKFINSETGTIKHLAPLHNALPLKWRYSASCVDPSAILDLSRLRLFKKFNLARLSCFLQK